MKKRLVLAVTFILALVFVVFGTVPKDVMAYNRFEFENCIEDGISYSISNDILSVSGTGEMGTVPGECYDAKEYFSSIVIGEGITGVSDGAFESYHNVTSVTLPETLQRIGERAFYGCTSLKKVTVPASVTQIGEFAFGWYSATTYKGSASIKDFNICGKAGTKAEEYAISHDFMFNGDTTWTDTVISMPKAKGMPHYRIVSKKRKTAVFTGFSNPQNAKGEFTIPDTIKYKGKEYKVIGIHVYAFANLKGMKKVTIGKNVRYINEMAFAGCSKLKNIVVKSKKIAIVFDKALESTANKLVIKVPAKKVSQYKKLFGNKGNSKVKIKKL